MKPAKSFFVKPILAAMCLMAFGMSCYTHADAETSKANAAAFKVAFKVAIVDMNRILNESKISKSKKEELDKISKKKKNEMTKKRDSLKKLESKLKEDNVSPDSPEADDYRAQARDLSRMIKDAEADMKRKFLKSTKELTTAARKVITEYAKKNALSVVFENSADAAGPVLYGASSMDITDAIIKELNKS